MQNAGGACVAIAAALIAGEARWDGAPILWLGLAWSVLGLSAGGLSLLVWLVRTQGPTRMSMLLLLVPPLAAVEAWLLFGEKLVPIQLAGFVLALTGVLLTGALLVYQHSLVRANDLSKLNAAFFTTNAFVSVILLATFGGAMFIRV